MTLAAQMYLDNASDSIKKRQEEVKKNIDEALRQIKEAMSCGDNHCTLLLKWDQYVSDWVVFPETIEYLEMNGFEVANYATCAVVSWAKATIEAEQECETNNIS
jgi:hypothetical protein